MCLRIFVRFSKGQQILDFETKLLPLVPAIFIGSWAEAAKSCFLRYFCCL